MKVILIGKSAVLNKIILPKFPIGNYWISENYQGKERKIVNIIGNGKNWEISNKKNIKVTNINKNRKKFNKKTNNILIEYGIYEIENEKTKDTFIINCLPTCENNFIHLNIKNIQEIKIGNDEDNDIIYNENLVAPIHTKIFIVNNRWRIENIDENVGTYVNNVSIKNKDKITLNRRHCIYNWIKNYYNG